MGKLIKFNINNIRNITQESLCFSDAFNIIVGENGAGKTSLLEGINLLATGRSFKTSNVQNIIKYNESNFVLFGSIASDNDKLTAKTVGFSKTISGERIIKLNGVLQGSFSEIARTLPIRVMSCNNQDSFYFSPLIRRRYLDLGLLYTNTEYYKMLRQFKQVLAQRNKSFTSFTTQVWDEEFLSIAQLIDEQRHAIFYALRPILLEHLKVILPQYCFDIIYNKGWDGEISLQHALKQSATIDKRVGFTTCGPHRADVVINCNNGRDSKDCLSRGQQKLVVYAINMALGMFIKQQAGVFPIYLVDDISSELDKRNQSIVIDFLKTWNAQVFITGLEEINVGFKAEKFHIAAGKIR